MYNNNQKVKHSDASAQMAITLKAKNDYLHHFKILTHFIGQSGHETKFRNQTNDFKPFLKKNNNFNCEYQGNEQPTVLCTTKNKISKLPYPVGNLTPKKCQIILTLGNKSIT